MTPVDRRLLGRRATIPDQDVERRLEDMVGARLVELHAHEPGNTSKPPVLRHLDDRCVYPFGMQGAIEADHDRGAFRRSGLGQGGGPTSADVLEQPRRGAELRTLPPAKLDGRAE